MSPPLSWLAPVAAGLALLLLALAALHDIAFRTLPDTVSLALAGCGAVLRFVAGESAMAMAVAGLVLALALPLWRAGWFGGGDAKLMPAVALLVPPAAVPELLLTTALLGGLLALPFLALRRRGVAPWRPRPAGLPARILRAERWRLQRGGPLPYGVAIAGAAMFGMLGG